MQNDWLSLDLIHIIFVFLIMNILNYNMKIDNINKLIQIFSKVKHIETYFLAYFAINWLDKLAILRYAYNYSTR
jgi:hypothetical protein